mmetsp:Transcript_66827/g.186566  ORF Transcript_66827/g.186566 Transcript_66827/m.186566 type:complete len:295 (-) Transcript_66827:1775-2659(-)
MDAIAPYGHGPDLLAFVLKPVLRNRPARRALEVARAKASAKHVDRALCQVVVAMEHEYAAWRSALLGADHVDVLVRLAFKRLADRHAVKLQGRTSPRRRGSAQRDQLRDCSVPQLFELWELWWRFFRLARNGRTPVEPPRRVAPHEPRGVDTELVRDDETLAARVATDRPRNEAQVLWPSYFQYFALAEIIGILKLWGQLRPEPREDVHRQQETARPQRSQHHRGEAKHPPRDQSRVELPERVQDRVMAHRVRKRRGKIVQRLVGQRVLLVILFVRISGALSDLFPTEWLDVLP